MFLPKRKRQNVPGTYVKVDFHELPADSVYTDGIPASPVLVSGWVRDDHPKAETARLATEVADAVTGITGVSAEHVLVVFQSSPASFAVEGGRVLPEPGERAGLDRRKLSSGASARGKGCLSQTSAGICE